MDETSRPLFTHLLTITDPRRDASTDHPLKSILFISVCAVICGADGWTGVAQWGESKKPWLSTFLDLPFGIPSHDTFRRVFSILNPNQFATAFQTWMADAAKLTEGAVIPIDGKTLRRSLSKAGDQSAIHMVSAFAAENGVVLGQVKTEEKSNEITAIPELLKLLTLKGCLVTIDAMGCQKTIAAQIHQQGGDYLLAVKGNQPTLEEIVEESVELGLEDGVEEYGGSYAQSVEKRAGAEIRREVWVMPAPDDLEELEVWAGLGSLLLAQRTVVSGGKEKVGRRLYISSISATQGRQLLNAVRQHWSIENQLHWSLDVAFDEDHSRIRFGHSAENMARLRHIALNLLKQEKTTRVGIKIKRNMAGWDDAYLLKVLGL